MNPELPNTINGVWMPTIVFFSKETRVTREQLQDAFAKAIDARVFFWPLSGLPSFESVETNIWSWDLHQEQ